MLLEIVFINCVNNLNKIDNLVRGYNFSVGSGDQ